MKKSDEAEITGGITNGAGVPGPTGLIADLVGRLFPPVPGDPKTELTMARGSNGLCKTCWSCQRFKDGQPD